MTKHTNRTISTCRQLVLVLLFSLFAGSLSAQTGLLWEIRGTTARPSYLLGTIHSDDPRVVNLPGVITDKLDAASSFTAELDLNALNILGASMLMFYTDGQSLKTRLEPRLYQDVVRLLASYGIPEAAASLFKPWAAAATLSLPKPRNGEFLDMLLYSRAAGSGKSIHGLETMAEQVASMEAMSPGLQIEMLKMVVDQYPALDENIEKLIRAWLARDLSSLQRISEQTLSASGQRLAETFNREVVTKRNLRMFERMQPRLEEGNAFIAVGALHLVGEQGLLRLLEKKGFQVRPVY